LWRTPAQIIDGRSSTLGDRSAVANQTFNGQLRSVTSLREYAKAANLPLRTGEIAIFGSMSQDGEPAHDSR
jgi:hypothetical protein